MDDVFVPVITFTESLFNSYMYLMVFPSSLHQEWPTYSSHWTEALSSVARTKKLRIRAPKFPLLQLLMATPLQMLEVDSSNSFPSELNKQQQMFKGTARKIIVYRYNKKYQFTITFNKTHSEKYVITTPKKKYFTGILKENSKFCRHSLPEKIMHFF